MLRLVQIWDHDWYNKQPIVKSMLLHLLHKSVRIYARHTTIRELSTVEEQLFFNSTHIQGSIGSSVCYGLIHNTTIVAAMSFGKSRYDKSIAWELLRFSNNINTTVTGGASKLLTAFMKDYEVNTILSYSHKHISNGNLYKKLGFEKIRETGPSYRYTKNYTRFFDRVTFQKHKLKDKLELFDPILTEWQNMRNNGYDRVWDCGNDVWIKGN